jgi:hypothetical protein
MTPDALAEWMLLLEHSGLGQAARSSVWLYPISNLVHVLGASLLVGGIATFDVAVLARMPVATAIGRVAIPIAAIGLLLQLLSGSVLFAAEATALAGNPAFQFKMALLVLGLVNIVLFHALVRGRRRQGPDLARARPFAAVSLVAWGLALLAGRSIAYV